MRQRKVTIGLLVTALAAPWICSPLNGAEKQTPKASTRESSLPDHTEIEMMVSIDQLSMEVGALQKQVAMLQKQVQAQATLAAQQPQLPLDSPGNAAALPPGTSMRRFNGTPYYVIPLSDSVKVQANCVGSK